MKALKTALRSAARRAGFELIPHWRLDQYPLDRHITVLFETFKIDYVIDVGANEGQFGEMLRRDVGYRGPILSFEPQHDVAETLRVKAAADGNWIVVQNALGQRAGRLEINVCASQTFTSFKSPDPSARTASSQAITRRESVEIRRLDSFEIPAHARVYLKIDTQGFDLEVIRGATGVLDRVLTVQTEVAFIPLYKDVPDWRESVDVLGELGFVVSGFYSVSHDEAGRLITGDCLLVRK